MDKINLILCYPPKRNYDGYGQDRNWFPIGIVSLAAYISEKTNNVTITCLDLFDYSQEAAAAEIYRMAKKDSINIIGFTMMTEQRFSVIELANTIHKNIFNCKIIVGGPHASIMHKQLSEEYFFIDHILLGEGEISLLSLVTDYQHGLIPERVIHSIELHDINTLPYAFNGLQYMKDFKMDEKSEIPIVFSRGCTDRCTFCSTFVNFRKYRTRSAYNIFSELLLFYNRYKCTYVKFQDDAATANLDELKKLCYLMISSKVKWKFELTARADQFDKELIELLATAGCQKVSIGIETGDEELRKLMNKKLDIAKAYQNTQLLKEAGIKVNLLLMVGFPGETQETIDMTCDLIRDFAPDSHSKMPFMIFPGTAVYQKLKREKWIDDSYWLKDQPQPYYTREHSLEKLYSWVNQINHCQEKYKILIAAMVNQDEQTFRYYLESLKRLNKRKNIKIDYAFVYHNSENLLKIGQEYIPLESDIEDEDEIEHLFYDLINDKVDYKNHNWDDIKFKLIAETKNAIVSQALANKYTHIFWVDSDLILHENTLLQLLDVGYPVVSEIFWTQWPGSSEPQPNCWDVDFYSFYQGTIERLKTPGLYYTGGTGACILVNTLVYKKGVNYTRLPNISWTQWEDRAFSIKCVAHGIPMVIDTTYPARHLYSDEDKAEYKTLHDIETQKNI